MSQLITIFKDAVIFKHVNSSGKVLRESIKTHPEIIRIMQSADDTDTRINMHMSYARYMELNRISRAVFNKGVLCKK